ncbi:MAG: hypothetical protein H7Y11_04000 [Armatimonadetes bacterium]|nr:hypothetical protein [Anaerolineae bacterium]
MFKAFGRIWNDIRNFKNIDAYVAIVAAIVFAAIGLFGDDLPLNVQMAVLLAGVGLLVYKTTVPEDRGALLLDDILKDRQAYGKLSDFIAGADTLWVYGASAVNVVRNIADIKREVLDRGGTVQVLLQDPQQTASVDILYRQLDKVHDLLRDIQDVENTLRRVREMPMRGQLEYRFLPYSPGFSLMIVDPDGKDGRLVVEFYGYTNEIISDRMHIEIHRSQSQHWFEYWERQFRVMWENQETRQV